MYNHSEVNHTDEEPVSDTVVAIHQICSTLLSTCGAMLNFMTVMAILRSRLQRQSAIAFVLNFIVLNFLVASICLPIIMVTSFNTELMTSNLMGCRIGGYVIYSTIGTELMALILIAVNRYFLIVHYARYQKIYYSRRNIAIMMVTSWMVYPIIFIFPLTETWGHFMYDLHRFACHPMNSHGMGNFIILFVLLTMVPSLGYCYIAIVYKVIKNRRIVNASRTNSKNSGYSKSDMQLVSIVILILTTFTILYIPFLVLGLLDPHMTKYGVVVHVISIYFGWSHVIVNPLIYSVMNRQIKQAYKRLLCKASKREEPGGLQVPHQSMNVNRTSLTQNSAGKSNGDLYKAPPPEKTMVKEETEC
ncbi:hypothetical protein FSP39_019472 [Pinctada imbricata]|uniref:G-protein coupled receptors family 1 profile domain-containing protein n=1 Tax=Pinctada imbricata TaxID=66713 RepID=A0AA88YM62_PINIB|nr:hypothetical protein FSP39_019472 [Pinctada imbricata]